LRQIQRGREDPERAEKRRPEESGEEKTGREPGEQK